MNIKNKLAEARVRLQEEKLKKSGLNKYAGYEYYELADFLPTINRLGKELGFVCLVSFGETATLEIVDTEKDEKLVFTSPMSTASLKGCHAVQNLGAVQTYLRRYLYQTAFEIVEAEQLDALPLDRQEAKQQVRAEEKKKIDEEELPAPVEAVKNAFNGEVVQPKKQPAKLAFEPKGGETTAEEKKEIGNLLKSKYADGTPIFSKEEMKAYSDMRKERTAREVIDAIKAELQKRVLVAEAPAESKKNMEIF